MPIILATQETDIRRMVVPSQAQANSSQDPISKTPSQKRAGRMAQVLECLPSNHEALSQTPVPPPKKKKAKGGLGKQLSGRALA
jgi:hypothetical protein